MIKCPQCLHQNPDDGRFCNSCGTELPPSSLTPTEVDSKRHERRMTMGGDLSSGSFDKSRFLPGMTLANRYRIVSLLGRGGMGEVYRADDLKLGQPVALKFLPEELEKDEDRLNRLLNEVKIGRQVSHPNVCRIYDIGEFEGQHYISMEYVDGEDLASLLRQVGRFPQDKAIQIARQVCAGMAAAHELGILHRDLKPSNVMIDGRGRVRITDFGLAALAETIEGREVRSGTPHYMAPEQLRGKEVSIQSDIYALGLVLYELFTGKKAFDAKTPSELAKLQQETTPKTPSSLVDGLDPAVERVILRCLEKDPSYRPQSALAVAAALPGGDPLAEALAAGETPSPEMVAAAGPQGGLHPGIAITCLIVIIVGIIYVTFASDQVRIFNRIPMIKSFEVLKDDARELAAKLGYKEPPRSSFGEILLNYAEYRAIAEKKNMPSRWDVLENPSQRVFVLQYRQSPEHLMPLSLSGNVRTYDPPRQPGDVTFLLDLEGKLIYLLANPPSVEEPIGPVPSMDWSLLFEAAGLNMADFQLDTPKTQPQVFADTRMAWSGVLPGPMKTPVRIEAAAFRGKPVYFNEITETSRYWSAQSEEERQEKFEAVEIAQLIVLATIFGLVAIGTLLLALRNLKLGRGDKKGALRIAIFVLAFRLLSWLFAGHHVASYGEMYLLIVALCGALALALMSWLLYIALEPYARRFWPEALVSWNRLLVGRFSDPIVGRDLLIGFTFWTIFLIFYTSVFWFSHAFEIFPPLPTGEGIHVMKGGRFALGGLFIGPLISLPAALGLLMLFLLLRFIFRRTWIAAIIFCLIMCTQMAVNMANLAVEPSIYAVIIAIFYSLVSALAFLILLIRFGLLATTGAFVFSYLIENFPITANVTAPYFTTSLIGPIVAIIIAVFALYTSMAGRPLFQEPPR